MRLKSEAFINCNMALLSQTSHSVNNLEQRRYFDKLFNYYCTFKVTGTDKIKTIHFQRVFTNASIMNNNETCLKTHIHKQEHKTTKYNRNRNLILVRLNDTQVWAKV